MLIYLLGKLRVGEFFFEVPVNYSKPAEESLRLFARSLRRLPEGAEPEKEDKSLPWFLYLTGGPGFGCYPPQVAGWTRAILDHGYEVSKTLVSLLLNDYYHYCQVGASLLFNLDTLPRPARDWSQPTNHSPNFGFERRCCEAGGIFETLSSG